MGASMFYARSPNKQGKWETLTHHLRRTAELCADFLSAIGHEDTGRLLGNLHDAGKRSIAFQEVLEGKRQGVNHAAPGAALALGLYADPKHAQSMGVGRMMAIAIAAHHSSLRSDVVPLLKRVLQGKDEPCDEEFHEIPLFGRQSLMEAWTALAEELPGLRKRPNAKRMTGGRFEALSQMLLIRLLFSGLVDADYSASGEHFDPEYMQTHTGMKLDAARAMENLLALREEKRKRGGVSRLNTRRDELFDACLTAGMLPPGLYTLTAPTGLGKTLALMAFALQHCLAHQKRRVILILPYLALTHQSADDYRKVIPDLLESHSAAELSEETRMLAERWSAPCIITTTVGFFEPLFSDRPTDCRRLHQIANSVIVLDEAQSLSVHLLDSTLACIQALCEQYGCTFVFSTATQPSYHLRKALAEHWEPREIVPEPQALYRELRRVTWDWRLDAPTTPEDLAREVAHHPQAGVIVNTRRLAQALYEQLAALRGEGEVFLMSTDLCPEHRSDALKIIQNRLSAGEPCLLVATQCIEAGVDMSVPVMYRALAPLESLIQAAGRCNRNGDAPDGRVVVFRFPDDVSAYPQDKHYKRAAECVVKLHARHDIDCANLSHIEEYYALLYPYDEGDIAALRDAIAHLDFGEVRKHYRLIDRRGINIIVPYKPELFAKLRAMADADGLTRKLMRHAAPIVVNQPMTDALARVCSPIRYHDRERGTDFGKAGWYMLEAADWYDASRGLLQQEHTDWIL